MKFSMVFSAVDKASKTMRKIMAQEKKMAAATRSSSAKAGRAAAKTQRTMSKTERTLASLARVGKRSFNAVVVGARRAGRAIGALHRKTVALGQVGFGHITSGMSRAKNGVVAGVAAITLAYGAAALAAGGLVGTASEFEKFQTILETTEGSAEKAQKAMTWVQNFAVKTPYELDQVTEAFVKLRSYGLDPTQGLMQSLGDTSAAMGKPLIQAVEAVADAVTGQNERLLEFGIKASKTGNEITYEYTNAAGESIRVAVEAGNRMAIQQQLMAIMNEKYAGSMERLSKTWDGMISNIWDMWTKFQMMMMNAGLFDWMKGKLRGVLDTINQMEADGTLQEWATQISNTIQAALSNIWEFGKGVFEIIQEVSGYLSVAAEYVGGWKNLSMVLGAIAFAPTLISTAAGLVQIAGGIAALSAALLANPIGLAIAAIAGGVYLIYKNWDGIGAYFQRIWDGIKNTVSAVWEWLKAAFSWTPLGVIVNNWSGITAALSGPIEAGKAAVDVAWTALKVLFNWNPLNAISAGWTGIATALSSPIETGVALVKTAWDTLKSVFSGDWLPDFSSWNINVGALGPIDWKALVGLEALILAWSATKIWASGALGKIWDALTSIEWTGLVNLEGIQGAWNSFINWFTGAAAHIWDLVPEMPSWIKEAFAFFENQPEIDFGKMSYQSMIDNPSGSMDRSKMTAKQLEQLKGFDELRARLHGTPGKPIKLIEDPKTLLAAADAAKSLEKQFPAIDGECPIFCV